MCSTAQHNEVHGRRHGYGTVVRGRSRTGANSCICTVRQVHPLGVDSQSGAHVMRRHTESTVLYLPDHDR